MRSLPQLKCWNTKNCFFFSKILWTVTGHTEQTRPCSISTFASEPLVYGLHATQRVTVASVSEVLMENRWMYFILLFIDADSGLKRHILNRGLTVTSHLHHLVYIFHDFVLDIHNECKVGHQFGSDNWAAHVCSFNPWETGEDDRGSILKSNFGLD